MVHNVWTYWEGEKPEYITLCHRSMERFCPGLRILTPETVGAFIGDSLHPSWKDLSKPAHRADAVRVAVIKKHGGTWVDSDTVFIRDYEDLKDSPCDLLFSRWNDGRVLNGYFYGRAESPIMTDWLFAVNKKLEAGRAFAWAELGERILTPLVYGKHRDACCEIDRRTFLPINIDKIPHVMFEEVDYKAFLQPCTVAVGLNHSWFCDNIPTFVADWEDPLFSTTLIGRLLSEVNHADN